MRINPTIISTSNLFDKMSVQKGREFHFEQNTYNGNARRNNSSVSVSNIIYSHIPNKLCQVYFMSNVIPVKSGRIDYGNKLYEGVFNAVCIQTQKVRADAKWISLDGKDLSNYIFNKSNFYKAGFDDTKLFNTSFEKSDLYGASFISSKTKNTNFRHSILAFANFNGGEFGPNTDMSGANIISTDFSNTSFEHIKLNNAIYNSNTILPKDITQFDKNHMILIEDGANLSNMGNRLVGSKLRNMKLANMNFENSSLKNSDLKRVLFKDSNLKNADLTGAYGRKLILINSQFNDAIMRKINLDDAELIDVDLTNTDLRGAILTCKKFKNIDLKGARYDQFTLFNEGFDPKTYGMVKEISGSNIYTKL